MATRKPVDLYSVGKRLTVHTLGRMSSNIIVLAFPNSPNPWKVAIILEELGIEYNVTLLDMFALKKKPFMALNPNGRTPVLIDHNNDGFVLWEVWHVLLTCT